MTTNKDINIYFYNFEGNDINTKKAVKEIVKKIKEDGNENFLGYSKVTFFEEQLFQQIGNININSNRISEEKNKKIEWCIRNFVNRFEKELKLKYKPLRFFIFPWFPDQKTSKDFGGVSAFATYFTVIHLYIDYKRFSLKSLEETLAHELNHLYFYSVRDNCNLNIKESIIAEGLAEHFREYFVGGKSAPWSKHLNKTEVLDVLPKLTPLLNSKNRKVYNNVFYGAGDLKRWTGYSVGYFLVKKLLISSEDIKWSKIMRTSLDKFYKL